jgi:hypothetical protein
MSLFESDASCAIQVYEPKTGSTATAAQCAAWCNSSHDTAKCSAQCDYVGSLPDGGIDCWMLCLPKDTCANGLTAQCNPTGEQNTVCVNATSV